MASSRGLAALVMVLLASACAALRVEESSFPGVWTVRAGDARDDQALRSIVSHAINQVYVLYAASQDAQALATIRVREDDDWLSGLSSHDFSSSKPGELTVPSALTSDGVEITVHKKQQLYDVTSSSSGDVALAQDVLASEDTGASLTATTTGAGDVYLPPRLRLSVAALTLATHGFGSVRLVASDVNVGSINVLTTSSGTVKLDAQNVKADAAVSVRVSSSGGASLSAFSLHAARLSVTSGGSGDAVFRVADTWSSSVAQCEYLASSAGSIRAGSVACANANVQVTSHGDVIVRVSNALSYSSTSAGNVYYSGPRPHAIASTSGRQSHSIQAVVSPEEPWAGPSWADTYTLPSHTPFKISDEERAADAAAAVNTKDAQGSTKATHVKHTFPWQIAGLIAVLVVVIAIKNARTGRDRGRADEKSRLLEEDTPVYI